MCEKSPGPPEAYTPRAKPYRPKHPIPAGKSLRFVFKTTEELIGEEMHVVAHGAEVELFAVNDDGRMATKGRFSESSFTVRPLEPPWGFFSFLVVPIDPLTDCTVDVFVYAIGEKGEDLIWKRMWVEESDMLNENKKSAIIGAGEMVTNHYQALYDATNPTKTENPPHEPVTKGLIMERPPFEATMVLTKESPRTFTLKGQYRGPAGSDMIRVRIRPLSASNKVEEREIKKRVADFPPHDQAMQFEIAIREEDEFAIDVHGPEGDPLSFNSMEVELAYQQVKRKADPDKTGKIQVNQEAAIPLPGRVNPREQTDRADPHAVTQPNVAPPGLDDLRAELEATEPTIDSAGSSDIFASVETSVMPIGTQQEMLETDRVHAKSDEVRRAKAITVDPFQVPPTEQSIKPSLAAEAERARAMEADAASRRNEHPEQAHATEVDVRLTPEMQAELQQMPPPSGDVFSETTAEHPVRPLPEPSGMPESPLMDELDDEPVPAPPPEAEAKPPFDPFAEEEEGLADGFDDEDLHSDAMIPNLFQQAGMPEVPDTGAEILQPYQGDSEEHLPSIMVDPEISKPNLAAPPPPSGAPPPPSTTSPAPKEPRMPTPERTERVIRNAEQMEMNSAQEIPRRTVEQAIQSHKWYNRHRKPAVAAAAAAVVGLLTLVVMLWPSAPEVPDIDDKVAVAEPVETTYCKKNDVLGLGVRIPRFYAKTEGQKKYHRFRTLKCAKSDVDGKAVMLPALGDYRKVPKDGKTWPLDALVFYKPKRN